MSSFELSPERYCLEELVRGSIFFDVGAHTGEVSKIALKLGHPPICIHAFEPNPASVPKLRSLGINVAPFGLANHEGDALMYGSVEHPQPDELLSLRKRNLESQGIKHGFSQPVKLRTLDSYCAEHEIHEIGLLKIDVEGHEELVLEGASRMLYQGSVKAILLEVLSGPSWCFADGYEPSLSAIVSKLDDSYALCSWKDGRWFDTPVLDSMLLAVRK